LVFVFKKLEFFLYNIPFHSANLQSRVKKGRMTQEKFEKTISLLKGVIDYESFKDVDMVIEVFHNAC
jgi:3-hydroxyacyl-CoA dehydrogenase